MTYPKNRRSPTFAQDIVCKGCGQPTPKTSAMKKYCAPCSKLADLKRKDAWFKKNGKRSYGEARSRVAERGKEISAQGASSLISWASEIDLVWQQRVSFPFHWAASKNHIYALRKTGHVALREESKSFRSALTSRIKTAMHGAPIVQNKVWLDILIQKPNHRGDAANFVDLICDAIKDAIGVDDRWFSIRRLDWQIVKTDPQIFVCIGQEAVEASQACSSCGRILPFAAFQKHRGTITGHARNCKECSSARGPRGPKKASPAVSQPEGKVSRENASAAGDLFTQRAATLINPRLLPSAKAIKAIADRAEATAR